MLSKFINECICINTFINILFINKEHLARSLSVRRTDIPYAAPYIVSVRPPPKHRLQELP